MTTTEHFHIHFIADGHELVGYRTFDAPSDLDARKIAIAVFELCQDDCEAVEVWRDGTMLFRLSDADLGQQCKLDGRSAAVARELEEALANSRWAIARSERLLAHLGRLR